MSGGIRSDAARERHIDETRASSYRPWTQIDWVGGASGPKTPPIPDTRPSIAARKAELRLLIKKRTDSAPPNYSDLDFNEVQKWKEECNSALKVYDSERSSVPDLEAKLNKLAMFHCKKESP